MKFFLRNFVYFLFAGIFCLSILVRMWKIQEPIADWHSFRQVDTASVAKLYVKNGIDLLHPRYHDLSNIQSGKDNPQGWRMVEFPLYQGMAALAYKLIPGVNLDVHLRFLTIIASSVAGLLLGLIVMGRVSKLAGLVTAVSYAVLPYSIFYGRVVLPDPLMVCFAVVSLFLLETKDNIISTPRVLGSAFFGALALLVKPQAAFLLLPSMSVYFNSIPTLKKNIPRFLLWGILIIIPFLLWRNWIAQFPEGIPAFDWLLNKNNIRFKGAWFYWLFAERIGKLILGYWGLSILGFGLVAKSKKSDWYFFLLLLGSLLYLVVIAGGNVQHDYYQILLLPVIAVYIGKGFFYLWETDEKQASRFSKRVLSGTAFVFMIMFSWYYVRSNYWINKPEIIEAGKVADKLLPKDAKVIAPYNGDTTFLYQTNRIGWPINFEIDKKISQGATHYVTISPTDADLETKELASKYKVLVRNDKYAIIDLRERIVQ